MSTPTPPTPHACEGYQAIATDGGYLYPARVHCNGCAETASLRQRLATAEAERDHFASETRTRGVDRERALADAAALREQLAEARLDLVAQIKATGTAEALALTNGAERDELRGLLEPWLAYHSSNPSDPFCGECDLRVSECDPQLFICKARDGRKWLRAHPAIPEGTPTATKFR